MIPDTESLWPYVLMTVFWTIICGWFLKRAWKGRAHFRVAEDGVTMLPERRASNRLEDTQAGRI